MKKFVATFCTTLLLANAAHAANAFIGADALFTNSFHKVVGVSSTSSGPSYNTSRSASGSGFGGNIGIRQNLPLVFVSGELFYDDLNLSAKNFASPNNTGDKIAFDHRYGGKVNAGITIFPGVKPFLTFGLANVGYTTQNESAGTKNTDSQVQPLYGLGVLVDLPLIGVSLKGAYDYQQFESSTPSTGANIRNHLGVARIGVIYNF